MFSTQPARILLKLSVLRFSMMMTDRTLHSPHVANVPCCTTTSAA